MQRIHITGSPRSGTTLMLELMSLGFEFDCVYKHETSVLLPVPLEYSEGVVCTKNPCEGYVAQKLLAHDPNQWIIFMVRDPRDVIVSRHGRQPNVYWTNLLLWNRSWDAISGCRAHNRLILVRYEDLVVRPDGVQEEIARRMPFLSRRDSFSRFHQIAKPSQQSVTAMGGVRAISDASIGNWRKHKARIAGQLSLHGSISEVLIELGYESDDRWLEEMEGVVPDITNSWWSDAKDEEQSQQRIQKMDIAVEAYLRSRGFRG